MKRRLYFLFPYPSQIRRVVQELNDAGIDSRHMHTVARDETLLEGLPKATVRQCCDIVWRLEWISWNTNLLIFLVALLGLLVSLAYGAMSWAFVCAIVMAATFTLGEWFTSHVPNVHLTEFTDALSHREILLMVDVPVWRVREIEESIHKHHPEAAIGGVGWTIERLGI
jgi:hypothetical protein